MDAAEKVCSQIAQSMSLGARMWRMGEGVPACEQFARAHHRKAPARASAVAEQHKRRGSNAGAVLCQRNWQRRFAAWQTGLQESEKPPYAAQCACLDSIHARCVLELRDEQFDCAQSSQEEPHRSLAHGPPGHGKTQLFLWIRSYFEKVWEWGHGVHFLCLGPMNTMAAWIKGLSLHAWGEIPVDRDETSISSGAKPCDC